MKLNWVGHIVVNFSVCGAIVLLVSWIIANLSLPDSFDKPALIDGLIAFQTSAVIAIFLTLFHSENRRIIFFRKNDPNVGLFIYSSVILNAAVVSIAPLFMKLDAHLFYNVGIDNVITTLSLILTMQTTRYLFLLVRLFMKQQA